MFQVCMSVPVYGSRDEYVGSRIYPIEGVPAYETEGMARRIAANLTKQNNDEYWGNGEIDYIVRVAGTLAPVPGPAPQPAFDLGDEDIPF